MSVSATTAAKKRRANNGSNPMFKSPSSSEMSLQHDTTSLASSSATTGEKSGATNIQRPMTLQQVITVFDNRLLNLEKSLVNSEHNSDGQAMTTTVKSDIDREYVEKIHQDFQDSLNEQVSEFDHRYQLLAKEVVELKHIVLKLQSYTLDVNKALIEERVQILTTDDEENEPLQIQPDDILDLHSDLESMQQSMTLDENASTADRLENISLDDKEESNEKNSNAATENIQTEIVEEDTVSSIDKGNADNLEENIVSITE